MLSHIGNPVGGRAESHSAGTGGPWASRGSWVHFLTKKGTSLCFQQCWSLLSPIQAFGGPCSPALILEEGSSTLAAAEWWGGKCALLCGFVTSCDISGLSLWLNW